MFAAEPPDLFRRASRSATHHAPRSTSRRQTKPQAIHIEDI
jgi:hypothetical protein